MSPRVLVIEGSESGMASSVAKRMVQKWSSKSGINFDLQPAVLSGNVAAKQFSRLKDSYDIILVLTSTFGEGDPPTNFERMLYELTAAGQAGARPLSGVQHAVLGFGDSTYETFQNCPRLVDKLMEDCGSRRLHARFEIDAANWSDAMAAYEEQWKNEVFDIIQSNPRATDAPACAWAEATPKNKTVQNGDTGKIFPKSLSELADVGDAGRGIGPEAAVVTIGVLALAIVAFFALKRRS